MQYLQGSILQQLSQSLWEFEKRLDTVFALVVLEFATQRH